MREAFLSFWQRNKAMLSGETTYKESASHLVFMAWLDRVANGGGRVDREFSVGLGRLDLLVSHRDLKLAIEAKTWRDGESDPLPEGLDQMDRYLEGLLLETGWLVIFDQRTGQPSRCWRTSGNGSL
jgi:hypothetical protein